MNFIRCMNIKGKKWGGILNILGGLVAFISIVIWIIIIVFWIHTFIELSVTKGKLAKANKNFNELIYETQKREYLISKAITESFNLGPNVNVSKESILEISGKIKFPYACKYYWIVFLSNDNLVWPKISIKNTGLQGQQFAKSVAVPSAFNNGAIVLVGVSDEIHGQFDKWLGAGRDAPLQKPSSFDVVLTTTITTY